MSASPDLKCCICKSSPSYVAASTIGPMSQAYCQLHLQSNIEPYSVLVAYLIGVPEEDISFRNRYCGHIIRDTLYHYKKTLQELCKDVDEATKEYLEDMI